MSSPAMKLGNWMRKTFPCVEKHTEPLKEEALMSVVDEIVLHTLMKHDVVRQDVENRQVYTLVGDLKISRPLGLNVRPLVEYKGKTIGICSNEEVLDKLNDKVREYRNKQLEDGEPERLRKEQEREARLLEILKEVSNETT